MANTLLSKLVCDKIVGNETAYSDVIRFDQAKGYCSMLIEIGASGSYVITQQCSIDGTTFYNPVDDDGTALGLIATGAHTASCYKQWSPVLCPYTRFKIVGTVGGGTLKMTLVSQEQ